MKTKIVILSTIIAVGIFAFIVFPVNTSAATIFTDNFESYAIGNLNGQGGWTTTSSGIKAQNTYVKEGEKAIELFDFYSFGVDAQKSGTLLNDGQTTIYFMPGNPLWQIFTVFLQEGNNERIEVRIAHLSPQYFDGTRYIDFSAYETRPSPLVWSSLQIQWRSSDHTARYSVNQSEWTPWAPTKSAWSTGLDTIRLRNKDNILRVDAIQENLIGVEPKNPVLIVPGLLGTEIKKGEELLWPDFTRMVNPFNTDSFMDPLQFGVNLSPSDTDTHRDQIIKKKTIFVGQNEVTVFDYTDGLINEFREQDYAENENLFTFPYDWRYGVSGKYADGTTNIDLLKQKINEILQQTGASKVDIVAHSLGGLLVKKYAMDNPADNNIGKAVFVGVPNTGAPKAVKVLLQGDNFNILGLNDAEIKKIAENMPSAYDLLPSQEYYNDNGTFVKTINLDAGELIFEEKDLNYQESKSFLTDDHNLNSLAMSGAEALHTQTFDDFDLRTAGIDLYSINGCKTGTIEKIIQSTKTDIFGYTTVTYGIQKTTKGDGTVPLSSANNLAVDDSNVFYAIKPDHGKMPSQNGIRHQIVNLISGSNLNTGDKIITKAELDAEPEKCELMGFWMWFLSPVSIEVIDQNNNRAGIAEDGSIQNDIPGADYQVMGERKFVFLPTDENQTYTINIQGEDTGTFTFKNSQIISGQTIQTEVFSNLPVTADLTGQINLTGTGTTLSLDTDGDGTTDQVLQPDAVLNPEESDDLLPPISTAILTGTEGQPSFYRSNVKIEINATDDNSGVLALEYNLDNFGFQKIAGDTATIDVSDEGGHTLMFFSTDNAGNNETEKIIVFTIDKTPPEAVIEFDSAAKDLKFSGIDNTAVSVSENNDIITITDQSGNTTEIQLKENDRKRKMRAEIKELRYNGTAADITKNYMAFFWIYDEENNLKFLSQRVVAKKNYTVLARYDGKQTRITGKDFSGKIKESFTGLKIIKVATNKGDFGWGY